MSDRSEKRAALVRALRSFASMTHPNRDAVVEVLLDGVPESVVGDLDAEKARRWVFDLEQEGLAPQ
jgi:hypothetical protein